VTAESSFCRDGAESAPRRTFLGLSGAMVVATIARATPKPREGFRSFCGRMLERRWSTENAADRLAALRSIDPRSLTSADREDWHDISFGMGCEERAARLIPQCAIEPGRVSPYILHPYSRILTEAAVDPVDIRRLARRLTAPDTPALPAFLLERTQAAVQARADLVELSDALAAVAARQRAPGCCALPNGASFVRNALALRLGRDCDPGDAIKRLRCDAEAHAARGMALLRRMGIERSTIGEGLSALAARSEDRVGHGASVDTALAAMNAELAQSRPSIWFTNLPGSLAECAVVLLTPAERVAGKGSYRTTATIGSPATYHLDGALLAGQPIWSLINVVHHEVLPGHGALEACQAAADPNPLRLRYAGGFAESWGIFGERLAARAGRYRDNATHELGFIHWQLFRIGRALVDLMLNVQGASIAEARATLASLQGFPAYFTSYDDDIAHALAYPGALAAESLGTMLLDDLAARTPEDPRQFNDRAVAVGPVPVGRFFRTSILDGEAP